MQINQTLYCLQGPDKAENYQCLTSLPLVEATVLHNVELSDGGTGVH